MGKDRGCGGGGGRTGGLSKEGGTGSGPPPRPFFFLGWLVSFFPSLVSTSPDGTVRRLLYEASRLGCYKVFGCKPILICIATEKIK